MTIDKKDNMSQDRLEQAIINVLETQAIMQNSMTTLENTMAKLAERQVDNDKRWFEVKEEQIKIRDELNQVINILNSHTILLEKLPDAIKEKIGFKAQNNYAIEKKDIHAKSLKDKTLPSGAGILPAGVVPTPMKRQIVVFK